VNVGKNGSVQQIEGLIQAFNSASRSDVIIDDSAGTIARIVELDNIFQPGIRDQSNMYVNGLSSKGSVYFNVFDVSLLNIKAGSGGNTFVYDEVRDTAGDFQVVLNTGSGSDSTRVITNRAVLWDADAGDVLSLMVDWGDGSGPRRGPFQPRSVQRDPPLHCGGNVHRPSDLDG
jgi:hypothetical protein